MGGRDYFHIYAINPSITRCLYLKIDTLKDMFTYKISLTYKFVIYIYIYIDIIYIWYLNSSCSELDLNEAFKRSSKT